MKSEITYTFYTDDKCSTITVDGTNGSVLISKVTHNSISQEVVIQLNFEDAMELAEVLVKAADHVRRTIRKEQGNFSGSLINDSEYGLNKDYETKRRS